MLISKKKDRIIVRLTQAEENSLFPAEVVKRKVSLTVEMRGAALVVRRAPIDAGHALQSMASMPESFVVRSMKGLAFAEDAAMHGAEEIEPEAAESMLVDGALVAKLPKAFLPAKLARDPGTAITGRVKDLVQRKSKTGKAFLTFKIARRGEDDIDCAVFGRNVPTVKPLLANDARVRVFGFMEENRFKTAAGEERKVNRLKVVWAGEPQRKRAYA